MQRTLSPLEAALLGILSVGWRSLEELQEVFDPAVDDEDVARAVAVLREEKLVMSWGQYISSEVLHATELGELTATQQREETLRVYHRRRAQHAPIGSRLWAGRR